MRSLLIFLGVFLLGACDRHATTTEQATQVDLADSLRGQKLLFLGAHPDDEWVLMPIFAEACLINGATCHFTITTSAELGCMETMGMIDFDACAAIRKQEIATSAAIANGSTEFLGWQDLFYAHDGEGLRRNLVRWKEMNGGREALVEQVVDLLRRNKPDVVFGIDPRHGSTCNPNHRATSLLLVEAVNRLPVEDRPRVLFENTYTVFERMTPEMAEAVDHGAMFPWPDRNDPDIFFDATRILPNGKRAIDYQLDALRAHPSQFPGFPDDASIDADPEQLLIPLVDLADIDPTEELCTPLDLSEYKTLDKTLTFVGRKYAEIAEKTNEPHAFRLTHDGEVIGEYGNLTAWPHSLQSDFPEKGVSLIVAAATAAEAEAVQSKYLQYVMRFIEAPA